MCVQSFYMVNIDVPAGVGAPPLDTQLPSTCWPYHVFLDRLKTMMEQEQRLMKQY